MDALTALINEGRVLAQSMPPILDPWLADP